MQLRYFFLLFAPDTISFKCDANGIEQILVAEWLRKEFDCPGLYSVNTHWDVAVGCDKYDRNLNVSCCKLALKIESTQSGQSDIQDEATGRIWQLSKREGVNRVKGLSLQIHGAEEKLERRAYRWIIIDNKDDGRATHEELLA